MVRSLAHSMALAVLLIGPAAAQAPVPDLYFNGAGWTGVGNDLLPPPSGPGPIVSDPAHPYISNDISRATGAQPNFRVADLSNPILLPWTREALRKQNEEALTPDAAVFTRESRCWPTGVPAFLLNPALPIYFLQTRDEVTIFLEPDHRVRHVYLNRAAHSANLPPTWYGESIGRYEGDTLVVDTIGFNDKTNVDNYRTPHTAMLHTIERYRVVGNVLDVTIEIDDPGAFTTKWTAIRRFRRNDNRPMEEVACAENNAGYFAYKVDPLPEDDSPDF